jgi:hypothetical protein
MADLTCSAVLGDAPDAWAQRGLPDMLLDVLTALTAALLDCFWTLSCKLASPKAAFRVDKTQRGLVSQYDAALAPSVFLGLFKDVLCAIPNASFQEALFEQLIGHMDRFLAGATSSRDQAHTAPLLILALDVYGAMAPCPQMEAAFMDRLSCWSVKCLAPNMLLVKRLLARAYATRTSRLPDPSTFYEIQ